MRIKENLPGASKSKFPVRQVLAGLSVSTAAMLLASQSVAQVKTVAGERLLEEIIVTARFKKESLQDAPVSITAISSEGLEVRGVSRIDDISAFAPSVTLQQNTGGFGKSVLAFIRGVGQSDFLPAFEPGVGLYMDGVYHGTLSGGLFQLTDVGQVEVLRGPQGTLFGKNNEGGAIRISSIRPRGDGSGFLEAGYGSYDRFQVRGAFDIGLVPDVLALRISGGVNSYDGHVDVVDFVCEQPGLSGTLPRISPNAADGSCDIGTTGGSTVKALKANLLYIPSDTLEINIIADVTEDTGEPTAERLLAVTAEPPSVLGGFGPGVPGYSDPSVTGFGIPYDDRFISSDPYTTYATYTDPTTGVTFPNVNDIRSRGISGTITWEVTPALTVTSITGYRDYEAEFIEIWGNAPIHINDNYFKPEHDQFSQELRISGNVKEGLFDWTVGGYYYRAHTELNDFIYLPEITIFNVFDPSAEKPGFVFYGEDPVEDRDKSLFAHGILHLTDALSLEGGLRYSEILKDYQFERNIAEGHPFYPVLPGFEGKPSVVSKSERLDYRASATYEWSHSLMTYATLSTGFKGGGINPRPTSLEEVLPFEEEELKSYEIGIKTKLFDSRLLITGAVFRSDYTDLQLATVAPGTAGNIVSNAGKVRIDGGELEIHAEPIDRFVIDASIGYIDFSYLELGDAAGVGGAPCKSCTAPFVPDTQATIGAQYSFDLGGAGTITPRIDWSYRSKTYNDLFNSDIASTDGYSLVNARIAYESASQDWTLAFEVRNLTDKLYYPNKYNQLEGAGVLVGQTARPREVFFSIRRDFN